MSDRHAELVEFFMSKYGCHRWIAEVFADDALEDEAKTGRLAEDERESSDVA